MASRRFIQKFDRLNADAQQHLERQIDLFHELGYTRPVEAPAPRVSPNVIPFPGLFSEEPAPAVPQRIFLSFNHDDRVMAKATINDELLKVFAGRRFRSR